MPIALVTGASRGLGLETSRQLVAAGFDVLLGCRDAAQGERVAAPLRASGRRAEAVRLDVAEAASVAATAALVEREHGRLDALVNNAGVSLDGFDAVVAARTLETNFHGAVRVTDALAPLVPAGGRIVMVSSGMGELSCLSDALARQFRDPGLTRAGLLALVASFVEDVRAGRHRERGWPTNAYRVSKVALNAFTRLAAAELADRGVRVNAVCPGWVRTDMGGRGAARSVADGARGIVWAATTVGDTGGFFRDGHPVEW